MSQKPLPTKSAANFPSPARMFIVSLLTVIAVFDIAGRNDGMLYIWPVTGLQLGLLLPVWSRSRIRIAAGAAGIFAGGLFIGMPAWFACSMAVITALDVSVAGYILSRGVSCFEDLKRSENLMRLARAVVVAPVVAGLINGFFLARHLHESLPRAYALSILCDSLGIAIVLPAVLLLRNKENWERARLRKARKAIVPGAVFVAVVAGVFWQTSNPFLFMVFPPMVVMVLITGLEGAVFISVALAAIACYATAHGHGPLWLSRSHTPEHQVLVLQMYLWMSVATALPIGSLLDERRRAEKRADEASFFYRTLLQNADDMIILSSLDGSRRYVSTACERLTGWTADEFMALDRLSSFHPDDRHTASEILELMSNGKHEHVFRYRIAQKAGGWRWVEAISRIYRDETTGEVNGYVGTVRDISHIKKTEDEWLEERTTLDHDKREMARLARTDALTALSNRLLFDEQLHEQVASLFQSSSKLAVMMIDIDYFKKYNDTYGHQAGDECLRHVAAALGSCVMRDKDVVARWGGEEFAVLLPGSDLTGAEMMARRMLESIRSLKIPHAGSPIGFVTVSIGAAELRGPVECEDAELIGVADSALYKSKHSGRNRFTAAGPATPAPGVREAVSEVLEYSGS
jgi:diguanylate cyclase (GGDEF)-like protein/PAS domain S-box-containing protein